MTILHFIPSLEDNTYPVMFLRELIDGGKNGLSSHIITMKKGVALSNSNDAHVDVMPPATFFTASGHKKFKAIVDKIKPDVVHIHSLWGVFQWKMFRWAEEARIPIVISPYKSLMEWNYGTHYLTSKLPQLFLMQYGMIKRASAIHVITTQEYNSVKAMSWHPHIKNSTSWNDKCTLVSLSTRQPDGSCDTARMASEMYDLYRKVVDSNPFLLMSEDDRKVEDVLLALGVSVSENVHSMDVFLDIKNIRNKVEKLTDEHWRRIQLHCSDQGVLQLAIKAVEKLALPLTALDVNNIDRFTKNIELPYLETAHAHIKVARMHQLSNDYDRYEAERQLCVMLLNTKYLYKKGKLSRRNLADLYIAIRFGQYNEYVLENMLDEIDMCKFSSRMFYVLHKFMLLEEGFVPFDMVSDRETKKIINNLFKSNVL